MKLFPLLFLNEAAKTPEQAISEGIAVIKADIWNNSIILFKVQTIIDAFKPHATAIDVLKEIHDNYGIVGLLDYSKKRNDLGLYKVDASAAILDYGPLAYQITMQFIGNDNWLMSDTSLKPASTRVWNKMYEFSNKGFTFIGEERL